jgi:serine/threonine protein kinase
MKNNIPSECIDLLHKILELSPKRRISAEDALKHPYFLKEMNFDKNPDSEIIS